MDKIYSKSMFSYHHSIVDLAITINDSNITSIAFEAAKGNAALPHNFKQALDAYFDGKSALDIAFTMPNGTEFQQAVWRALCDIPCGEVRSYKEIATAIGKPKAARAVGMACNKNPLPIIVPCHRVVGSNGALTGYAGGLELKKKLLKLEN